MEGYIQCVETNEQEGKRFLTIFFAGCNFSCPWCNTPELLNSKEEFLVDLKEIKKQIKEQSAGAEGVLITGGEPLFQRLALIDIAKFCRELELKVALQTNASKPLALRSVLEKKFVDALFIDFKSPLLDKMFERVTKSSTFFIRPRQIIDDFRESLKIIKDYSDEVEIEFMTRVIPSLMFRKEDFLNIAEEIKDIQCRWRLTRFQPGTTFSKSFSQLKPPSEFFLEDLKENIQKTYPQLRIDID